MIIVTLVVFVSLSKVREVHIVGSFRCSGVGVGLRTGGIVGCGVVPVRCMLCGSMMNLPSGRQRRRPFFRVNVFSKFFHLFHAFCGVFGWFGVLGWIEGSSIVRGARLC